MRAAFSRLPKIAFPAGIWLKWLSLLPCFFQGLLSDEPQLFRLRYQLVSLFSQIWAWSQHAGLSARHRSETSHCPQVQNYGATPEHLEPTHFGQLAGTDSLSDSRCHHPETWLSSQLQTELAAFPGAVDFNGHFHGFSRSTRKTFPGRHEHGELHVSGRQHQSLEESSSHTLLALRPYSPSSLSRLTSMSLPASQHDKSSTSLFSWFGTPLGPQAEGPLIFLRFAFFGPEHFSTSESDDKLQRLDGLATITFCIALVDLVASIGPCLGGRAAVFFSILSYRLHAD